MQKVRYSSISQARLGLSGLMSLLLLLVVGVPVFATAPTLPVTGVAIEDWIPVVVTAFGAAVLAIVGAYFAFLLIKKGMQWGRKAFG